MDTDGHDLGGLGAAAAEAADAIVGRPADLSSKGSAKEEGISEQQESGTLLCRGFAGREGVRGIW